SSVCALASAEIYLPEGGVTVAIRPSSVTLPLGGTQTFTATVMGTTDTAVTWSIQEGTQGGTITSEGVYTAPSATGMFHVVASSQADTSKSATATVTVAQGPGTFVSTGSMSTSRD